MSGGPLGGGLLDSWVRDEVIDGGCACNTKDAKRQGGSDPTWMISNRCPETRHRSAAMTINRAIVTKRRPVHRRRQTTG